jgi:hypothetical protein
VLRPLIAHAFLLTGEEGLAYLHSYGTEVQARWAQFQQRMNQLSASRCAGLAACSRGAGCRPFSWRINWKFWSKNWQVPFPRKGPSTRSYLPAAAELRESRRRHLTE